MNVVAFSGYSGSGKTTLIEQLVGHLKTRGRRVSVIKHAHHRFDIDHPGKDSWRHRQAGAFEVLIASDRRLALMREFETLKEPDAHGLIAQLSPAADWVLVEGFKHGDLPKVEVWRSGARDRDGFMHPVGYPLDRRTVAVCTDLPAALPSSTDLPVLPLDDAAEVARWLLEQSSRFRYEVPVHG